MGMNTLDWFLSSYNHLDYVILRIGKHEIVINIYEKGSATIYDAFANYLFKFVNIRNNILTLERPY